MRAVNYSNAALKFLKSISVKHAQQIYHKIDLLAEIPPQVFSKKVIGYEGIYRVKSGEYRIIWRENGEEIDVLLIDKRNDDAVYKKLERI